MGTTCPRLRFPSPALVLSCLALFAALGGSTYAATSLGSSSLHFTNATLENGWMRYSTAFAPAGYVKDSSGVVHLRGGIKGGANFTTAFVLPSGLRPSHTLDLPVYTFSGSEGNLTINRKGHVKPSGPQSGSFTSLDGISFAAGE